MADSLEQVIREYLVADAVFYAKFAGIYWIEAPDSATYPYLVYWQIDDTGTKVKLNEARQGEARIQFNVWDNSSIRGVRLREDVKEKVEELNEVRSGYNMVCIGTNEATLQRGDIQEPFHFVIDGVIRWNK